jgi:hypothetical protein
MRVEVTGIEAANKKLEDELQKLGNNLSERFVTKSMIAISAQTLPMIPIDTSFLVNSEYRKVDKWFDGFVGEIGYGAFYAPYVHDAPGTLTGEPRPDGKGVYWGPDGEPGFLAKGVQAFIEDELDRLIQEELGD